MLCRSVSLVICTFFAVFGVADFIAQDSVSDSSTAESVEEVRPDRAVDLGALLDHGYGSVVALVAGDTRLVAHRAVLAARSPVLRRLLQDIAVGELAVPDVEGPALRQLVAYLYTLRAPQLPGTAPQLLAAADQYGLPALKADCERQVAARLSVETAAAAAVVAVRHSSDSLRKAAVAFIRAHIFRVMATQGWADAIHSQPRAMTEVARLLSESPVETGTPASAASRTAPTTELESVRRSRGQTPASSASPTTSDSSVSSGSTDICLLCSSAPAESGPSPYRATQPHSDYSDHQTPTAAVTTVVAQTITHPDDDHISRLRSLSAEEKGERLIEAAKEGALEEIEALLAAGADVAARGEDMRTALHWAAAGGYEEAVRRLLAAGADVAARDQSRGWTALHWAADREHEEAARRLLAAGAAVDATDRVWQRTPLHWAADDGHTSMVRLLLAAGADHGASDEDGYTPLHRAAYWGHTEAAAALLQAGANRGARNRWGSTPLDVAWTNDRKQVAELLQAGSGTTPE